MRVPTPRALFCAGLVLLAACLVGSALYLRTGTRPSAVRTDVQTTAPATTSALPQPFAIETARATAAKPYTATISWSTTEPATARVAWGPRGMAPVLWTDATELATSQTVTLHGLAPVRPYVVHIDARSLDGDATSTTVDVDSGPTPAAPAASTDGGVISIDGEPTFPLITWEECPDRWAPDVAEGITLFAGNPCTGLPALLNAVAGRALAAGTTDDVAGATGPGLIGWFHPDEADARGLTGDQLAPQPGVDFLTLTSHFFSAAPPLPAGREIYPGLVAKADVVGFDMYPLQESCSPALLPAVFDAQRELVALTGGKPTYQWIEVREMKCTAPEAAVTARTIAVESWLAIAGGAHALGFFPSPWGADTGAVIGHVASRIRQLQPALLQPPVPLGVATASPGVRAAARSYNGASYVIAVNAGSTSAHADLTAADFGERSYLELGASRWLAARKGALSVDLPPLSVRIYVAPPS
jgi:hypothetical protein